MGKARRFVCVWMSRAYVGMGVDVNGTMGVRVLVCARAGVCACCACVRICANNQRLSGAEMEGREVGKGDYRPCANPRLFLKQLTQRHAHAHKTRT